MAIYMMISSMEDMCL